VGEGLAYADACIEQSPAENTKLTKNSLRSLRPPRLINLQSVYVFCAFSWLYLSVFSVAIFVCAFSWLYLSMFSIVLFFCAFSWLYLSVFSVAIFVCAFSWLYLSMFSVPSVAEIYT
jgi:hypothetical protein